MAGPVAPKPEPVLVAGGSVGKHKIGEKGSGCVRVLIGIVDAGCDVRRYTGRPSKALGMAVGEDAVGA